MADEITIALQQGTGSAAPAPADDPSGIGGAAPSATGAGSDPAGTPEPDDQPQSIRDYLAANPTAKDAVDFATREYKRGITPKLMEAADLRKKLEGLDDNSLQSLRELNRMAQTDPKGASEWLRRYADQLSPAQAAALTQNPPPEYQTDGERALYGRIQELEGRLQKTAQGFESLTLQQQAVQVGDQFNKIGAEMGVEIPNDVRRQCFEQSRAINGALSPTEIYFAKNRDAIVGRAAQRARDEAAGVVAAKGANGAGNPNGVTPRTSSGEEPDPKDLAGLLRQELAKRET